MRSIRLGASLAGAVVAAGIVAYAVFGSGSHASAADPPKGGRGAAFEQALADALNIPLTQLQAAEAKARSQVFPQGATPQGTTPQGAPNGRGLGRGGPGGPGFFGTDIIALASQTLGLSQDAIRQQLQSGQTLAQIAGPNAGALKTAIVDAENANLQKAVANGTISPDAANKITSNIPNMVDRILNSTRRGGFNGAPGGLRPNNGAPNLRPGQNQQ